MSHVFICAIGPVQDFIATARRSRDLWYGSWMLSELSKAAANFIVETYGIESLIFPAPKDKASLSSESNLNVANKVVAVVDDLPENYGELVRGEVRERLEHLRKNAFGKIIGAYNGNLATEQLDDLLEFYWVSVTFDQDYSRARDQAEALLAARKNTRNFEQKKGAHVLKSSLDGARESVIPEDVYPTGRDSEQERLKKIRSLYDHYRARQGERLSGVDLLKRLGLLGKEPEFKSTSHMAALPFLARIENDKGKEQVDAILEEINHLFKNAGWDIGEQDGALIYESRVTDWIPTSREQQELRKKLNDILAKYTGNKFSPNPYYALMLADGDNMGKTIDAQIDDAAHRKLSQKLSQFAEVVPQIIRKYQGVPIYAGGDDILTYLPLHTVLECALELEQRFEEEMNGFTFHNSAGNEFSPTLSTGIVIAHHLTPLSDVLEMARGAEKEAKGVDGKNALAITLSKRSGIDRTIRGKWENLYDRLNQLIQFARKGEISTGTAYELRKLDRSLSPTDIPLEGMVAEAMRIIKRKRESGGDQPISDSVQNAFQKWLEVDEVSPAELARQMVIAQMFASVADLASGQLVETQEASS